MQDYKKTILSQYANSPAITEILANINENIDTKIDIENFYKNYFDPATAVGAGLDIWGAVVGVGRRLKLTITDKVVGFDYENWNANSNWLPLSQAPAFSRLSLGLWTLDDSAYRQVIFAKAASNISDGSIPSLNNFLKSYFGSRGTCYAKDNNDMSVTYVCKFVINDFDVAILTNNDIAPSLSGTIINIQSEGTYELRTTKNA